MLFIALLVIISLTNCQLPLFEGCYSLLSNNSFFSNIKQPHCLKIRGVFDGKLPGDCLAGYTGKAGYVLPYITNDTINNCRTRGIWDRAFFRKPIDDSGYSIVLMIL